ncbi:DUF5830 family protein [Halarchaeum salinum]|uniref:MarR family transcriptional regulator n=1 Tax=Halarchaeum salinum TaxID=489912 RepID=A0AAV3SAR3_9EURY
MTREDRERTIDDSGMGEEASLDDPRFRADSTADGATAGTDADTDTDGDTDADADGSPATPPTDADPIELGVALIERLEDDELSMAELMDRVETVSTHPRIVREIIEAAEERGLIERDGATVRPQGGGYVRFGADVVTKEGEFSCRRCGTGLSKGYFIRLDTGEIGPFGSSCIRKVTGRE